jgi:hypothetical protein
MMAYFCRIGFVELTFDAALQHQEERVTSSQDEARRQVSSEGCKSWDRRWQSVGVVVNVAKTLSV